MRRILELLNTMEEGILHTQKQLEELRYEESCIILQDVVEAVLCIEDAINPMENKLPENDINFLLSNMKDNLGEVVNSYEQNKFINLENQISKEIIPAFENWKEEIEKTLRTYIAS